MEEIKTSRKGFLRNVVRSVAVGGLGVITNGCDNRLKREGPEEILSVEPHHATRILITYKDKNGMTYTDTIHQSNEFKCGDISINPHDFLSLYGGSMPYGRFDADKYKEYRMDHKKKR